MKTPLLSCCRSISNTSVVFLRPASPGMAGRRNLNFIPAPQKGFLSYCATSQRPGRSARMQRPAGKAPTGSSISGGVRCSCSATSCTRPRLVSSAAISCCSLADLARSPYSSACCRLCVARSLSASMALKALVASSRRAASKLLRAAYRCGAWLMSCLRRRRW